MVNKLTTVILGSIAGIIVVVPIGLIFGGLITGIAGAIFSGGGAYFIDDLLMCVRARFKK